MKRIDKFEKFNQCETKINYLQYVKCRKACTTNEEEARAYDPVVGGGVVDILRLTSVES